VQTRNRLRFGLDLEDKVTAISVFDRGSSAQRASVCAGEIGRLWGLGEIQIGDRIGEQPIGATHHQFGPPTFETVVVPRLPADRGRLRVALSQLAEQDPLINIRQDDTREEISVSLYGEVQKEVIEATLADDFGVEVTFRETTTVCIERPLGTGSAIERIGEASNPFLATVGLRIDAAPIDSGIDFQLRVGVRSVPMYVYKTAERFAEGMAQYVRHTLQEGLSGWHVTDCIVTMTDAGYSAPVTTAADFRTLTPLVLMGALELARTEVCEPMVRIELEIPAAAVGAVLLALVRLDAIAQPPERRGALCTIEAVLAAARVNDLQRQLPGLTGGEGVLETTFDGYRAIDGDVPTRRRTSSNPLNREEYLMHLAGRITGR
jgi:ribosomal protection tetracycline resistance protein